MLPDSSRSLTDPQRVTIGRAVTSFGLVGIVAASFGQNRLPATLPSTAHGHPSAGPQSTAETLLLLGSRQMFFGFRKHLCSPTHHPSPSFYWPSYSHQLLSWFGGKDFSPKLLRPAPLLQSAPSPRRLRILYIIDQRSTGGTGSALTLVGHLGLLGTSLISNLKDPHGHMYHKNQVHKGSVPKLQTYGHTACGHLWLPGCCVRYLPPLQGAFCSWIPSPGAVTWGSTFHARKMKIPECSPLLLPLVLPLFSPGMSSLAYRSGTG